MTVLAELIPDARALSRTDKLRLIQLLAEDLTGDDGTGIRPDASYAVWSPADAFFAADVMSRALAAEARP